jgi:hypothetical protein
MAKYSLVKRKENKMEIVEEIGHEQKRFVIRKRKDDKMPVIDL